MQFKYASLLSLFPFLVLVGCTQQSVHPTQSPDEPKEVIEIDLERLSSGDMRYNIRIYDGDVIWPSPTRKFPDAKPVDLTPDRVRVGGIGERQDRPAYQIKPGDTVLVTIYELRTPGVDDQQQRRINDHGELRLAVVGPLHAAGKSPGVLEADIARKLEADGKLRNATVTVQMLATQQTFSVARPRSGTGHMPPGTHDITKPGLRLLEALKIDKTPVENYKYLYVVRSESGS